MPGGHLSLKPKRLGETCFGSQPFDFAASMSSGETISTQVVTASVYSGTDPSPGGLISGAAVVQNADPSHPAIHRRRSGCDLRAPLPRDHQLWPDPRAGGLPCYHPGSYLDEAHRRHG